MEWQKTCVQVFRTGLDCCRHLDNSCLEQKLLNNRQAPKAEMNSEDKTLVEIIDENKQIELAKYINYVSAPQAGAIATFLGTTRDIFEGKTVVELRYEAMYQWQFETSTRSSWELHSIAVAHRVGSVPVGETSVFISVSATHRADALDACKFLIDELKASVPIWKKEVYSNGEVWKENTEFLERRFEHGKDGSCCRRKIKTEARDIKGCCKPKVKEEDAADISTS
ncbi:molybdopterin synthase catalytic subunit-like [Gossypium australe]|uniref:Molybdopterin synthase catalytic subunit-like n=1 Tax=Gossypium australe TaxID=47621 RepID=A0A5B6UYD8_9ROSI|nr:molybdopterin synthase catalytic subunit-like [Gossypium australe]